MIHSSAACGINPRRLGPFPPPPPPPPVPAGEYPDPADALIARYGNYAVIGQHPTLWIDAQKIVDEKDTTRSAGGKQCKPWRRLSIDASPPSGGSGGTALKHTVLGPGTNPDPPGDGDGDLVMGQMHSKIFNHNCSSSKAIAMVFEMWASDYSGWDGKMIELEWGRGLTGPGYRHSSGETNGSTDGGGVNTMHALIGSGSSATNRICGFGSFKGMPGPDASSKDSYGSTGSKTGSAYPKGKWFTVTALMDTANGWEIYMNNAIGGRKWGGTPTYSGSMSGCKAVAMTLRPMHGGEEDKKRPIRGYNERWRNIRLIHWPK